MPRSNNASVIPPNARNDTSDESLMARFATLCCNDSFRELTERYTGNSLAVAAGYFLDRQCCEDAVQEAFLRVVKKRETYSPDRLFAPWYYRILRNVCVDMVRKRRRRKSYECDPYHFFRVFDTEGGDASPISLSVLETLPPKERKVLYLKVVHDMKLAEVAQALGCSEEAAKKRAQRGIKHLRDTLLRGRTGRRRNQRLSKK
ncbi:MAG: sigma-70 family RNA polymerase sigma factor [Chitinivibrionales bacterium]|nr:sigma-70 family RNA polymerase sigma factor [Chitinivibrionales bacterium]MBD3357044.1 sigma-70 family RNA polymerase sigma factor [Chitinivibrionales bacterium]